MFLLIGMRKLAKSSNLATHKLMGQKNYEETDK